MEANSRRTFPKGPVNYESHKKKTARRLSPSSSRVQSLRREQLLKLLYQILGKMQAPIWTRGEGFSPCPGNLCLQSLDRAFW